jgi:hypothetical protein
MFDPRGLCHGKNRGHHKSVYKKRKSRHLGGEYYIYTKKVKKEHKLMEGTSYKNRIFDIMVHFDTQQLAQQTSSL